MNIRQSVNDEGHDLWDDHLLRSLLRKMKRGTSDLQMILPRGTGSSPMKVSQGRCRRTTSPFFRNVMWSTGSWVYVHAPAVAGLPRVPGPRCGRCTGRGRPRPRTLRRWSPMRHRSWRRRLPRPPRWCVRDVLLPLPTNEGQQRILVQAQHSTRGGAVRGHRGSKSHTIANHLSH